MSDITVRLQSLMHAESAAVIPGTNEIIETAREAKAEIERLTADKEAISQTASDYLHENERLRAALARRQEPEGEREERVAEWLRSRGYNVTRHALDGEKG